MHMLLFCLFLSFSNAFTYEVNELTVIKHQIVDTLFRNIVTFEEKNETLCQKHLNVLKDPSQFSKTWVYRSKYVVFHHELKVISKCCFVLIHCTKLYFLIDLARIYYHLFLLSV